jgi:[acyl-carrier-protein] S-malonyltransferase
MSTAWIFPGQGTQKVGMGKALFDASAAARDVFQRADDALGFSISQLCFDGPQDELTLTAHAQPAIVTTSIAALAALREAVPALPLPTMAAGHSLGEYSALVAAGAFSLEDAVRLVHLRGRAMQEAVPAGEGAMAAILGGDADAVAALCADAADSGVVSPANFNAPGQIVIAGAKPAVARASELAKERKLKVIPLDVSAPFHCALMEPAARAMEEALGAVTIQPLSFSVVANATGTANADAGAVRDLLVRQIASAVLWEPSVRHMVSGGMTHALEIGPGKVLAGLLRKIDKSILVQSVGDPEGVAVVRDAST